MRPPGAREVLGLAGPTLVVLVAEPLYLLLDLAVVGRLGVVELAALAGAAIVFAQVTTQLTFLSYGTTARAARAHGAGRSADAIAEGVQATWLALGIGAALTLLTAGLARHVLGVLTADGQLADAGARWLGVVAPAIPAALVAMAGNGWMRGVQRTAPPALFVGAGVGVAAVLCPVLVFGLAGAPRMGLVGSAVATLVGHLVAAVLFLGTLGVAARRAGVSFAPRGSVLGAQLVLGRDLVLRSLAFQVCFIAAAAVAARVDAAALGAHQATMQVWNLLSLVLDSLAIAAQTLVGAALGAGVPLIARAVARRIVFYSVAVGLAIAVLLGVGAAVLPRIFTGEPAVLDRMAVPWWFLVALVPVAAAVFAFDGVLLGAADASFLRTATLVAALGGFLPLIIAASALQLGLAGIWAGLAVFILLRLGAVVLRYRGDRWTRTEVVA